MIGDLHCHTRLSDGSLGIDELIYLAKRIGLNFLSITDHDCISGLSRAAIVGKRVGINIIPGTEISGYSSDTGHRVHILCYLFDKPDRLEGMLLATSEQRKNAGTLMLKNVMRYYPVTAENVAKYATGSRCIYKQHIMHALMDLGYTGEMYGSVYNELFGKNGSCVVDTPYPDVYEILKNVHAAGGIAVFAHPGMWNGIGLAEKLADEGLIDGIEVWHPSHSEDDVSTLSLLCEKHRLIKLGGSDFHGMYRPMPNPVSSCITPASELAHLFDYKDKHR